MRIGQVAEGEYNIYRNRLTALIRLSKKNFYYKTFSDFKSNTRKLWKTINHLTNSSSSPPNTRHILLDNKLLSSDNEIANAFNSYFSKIALNLDSELPPARSDPLQYLTGNFPNSMVVPETTIQDIVAVLKTLKTKPCSVDDFSVYIIKANSHLLVQPLALLFNQSISTGTFPHKLKHAIVTPVYKKGSRNDLNNYRPISILNIFSKIFEKLMKNHLVKYISDKNILYEHQYGFQKNKSTLDALLHFSESLYKKLDSSKFILSIFVDYSKAFDTVPHSILLKKLDHYGIRGKINEWFSSYLTNRTQKTKFRNCTSDTASLKLGVPQGSVLGPILFLLFVNDLPNFSNFFRTILFADDANLSVDGDNPTELIASANIELDKFYFWCTANRLSLNILKTFYILFANKPPAVLPPLVMRSNFTYYPIKRVDNIKFLGVYYDEKMSFKYHINHIASKISRISALIYRAKNLMPPHILKMVYEAHVNSILNYCNPIWANTYPTYTESISKLLKRIVRNITHSDFLAHTKPLFQQLQILDFDKLRKLSLGKYVYNNRNAILTPLIPNHGYPTRNRHIFRLPERNTALFERSFLYEGPRLWNTLMDQCPLAVSAPSVTSFKRRLKKFLLQS